MSKGEQTSHNSPQVTGLEVWKTRLEIASSLIADAILIVLAIFVSWGFTKVTELIPESIIDRLAIEVIRTVSTVVTTISFIVYAILDI